MGICLKCRVWNELSGSRPSTGQIALMFAIRHCKGTVSVYGFDRSTEYSNQYHLSEDRSTLHDWIMETQIRQCLADASLITFQPAVNLSNKSSTLAEDLQAYMDITGVDLQKYQTRFAKE